MIYIYIYIYIYTYLDCIIIYYLGLFYTKLSYFDVGFFLLYIVENEIRIP